MSSTPHRQQVTVALRRDLGLLDITMIGVGAMIGTSIFVLIGVATAEVGAAVLLVIALNGITTLFTAATYAELGSSFPEAGGGYLWAKKALPHPAGFLSGWLSWFGHTVACSYYSLGFGFAMVALLNHFGIDLLGLDDSMLVKLFATTAITFFLGINYAGVGATGKTGDSITLVQVLILAFFVTFAVMYALDRQGIDIIHNFDSIIPENRDLSKVLMVMGFTFIAFEGYEIIVQCGEEVKDPKKNIPKAIFISVVVAAVLYASVAIACLANQDVLPGENIWSENTVINAAAEIIPFVGAPLLIFGGILSAMAALNATVFSSSRVSFAMGRDGSLPKAFGMIHEERRVPHKAIAITGFIMLFMALMFPLEIVVASTSIIFLLLFSIANSALIRLRRRLTAIDVGYRTPLFPLVPVVGVVSTLGIAAYLWWLIPEAWYIAIVWIAAGLAVSAVARPREEPVSIVQAKRVPPKPLTKEQIERFRVFLALENLGDLRLVEIAGLLARYFNGELTVNKIVEVPGATPLDAISKDYIDEISAGLKKAIKVTPSTVVVHPVVSISHDVAGAIVDRTRYETANLLLLGWKGTRRRGRTILGRNLDRVVREAPCDVAIIKTFRLGKSIENILLVSGGYFETRKALLLALPLAREFGAKVQILSVITDEGFLELARGNAERLSKMCDRVKVASEVKYVHSKSLVNAVMENAVACDILVMGTGPQSTLERTMFGAVYDRIIRSVDVPVLVLKTARGTRSGFSQMPPSPRPKVPGLD
ncbi:MAG: amino acid permease [Candidatus Thermoplasmatota archaeon]|nr:amino acid permease [Candidatus Thermoplasmatota archaeon]